MNREEIIFFIIVAIAYAIFALTVNIPLLIHAVLAILILAGLAVSLLLKYKPVGENEKISKILAIASVIVLILYVISTVSELWFNKTLVIDSGIFLFLFMVLLIMEWFFKKSND
jgi:uncharacterized membrane protein